MGPYFPSIKYYLCDTSKGVGEEGRLMPFGAEKFTEPAREADGVTLVDPVADAAEQAAQAAPAVAVAEANPNAQPGAAGSSP